MPLGNARVLAARLPNARVHVVKGGRPSLLLDEPHSAARAIFSFLDEEL